MGNSESKHEKFIRIAEARTNKIVGMIRLLGNCSNQRTYEYTKEDISKIFNYIDKELKSARIKFEETQDKEEKFKLR
ncbi:MAG: hypothetical protein PF505_12225 [Vallitaleaceae bacterium]|nr:hypothetical protein [Vallitaleaceae bacterium]